MKLAALLVVVAACGPKGSAPAGSGTTTSSSTAPGTSSTASGGTTTTAPVSQQQSLANWQQAGNTKASYSCFSYKTDKLRHACTRADDCPPYLEQTKAVPGVRDITGCANAATVFCFHQPPTKDDPDGLEVCQPTADECKVAREDLVKAKMSVDSDCAQR